MNGHVPDWNVVDDYGPFMNDLPSASQKVSMRADQGLIELVWQNGHVIMQNQHNCKNTPKQPSKLEVPSKCGGSSTNPSDFFDEEETAAWFQHPLDDTLDKEFCSQFFQGMQPIGESKLEREAPLSSDLYKKSGIVEDAELLQVLTPKHSNKFQSDQNTMPPPKSQHVISIPSKGDTASGIVNFSHFSRPMKLISGYSGCREVERNLETNHNHKQQGESSLPSSKLSDYCGSNQIQDQPELMHTFTNVKSDPIVKPIECEHKANERGHIETHDRATITSPSAGSGTSAGRTCTNAANHKRKGRDDDELECQSEETDYQSTEVGKPQRSTTRRSRAAEVHNLSERRRRDRINEKMKALQELIPHCNKTDKASMLDEAIEYLKSLQLQVQMMWMGNGMAPMMFPSAQHYLSFMGTMPRIPGAVQMPPLLFGNQTMSSTTSTSKTTAGQSTYSSNANQSQHSSIPEAFLHYLGVQNVQSPEGMKMFAPYASQLMQSNCPLLSMSSCSPVTGTDPPKDDRNG